MVFIGCCWVGIVECEPYPGSTSEIFLSNDKRFCFIDIVQTFLWREIGGADACRPSSALLRGANAFPVHRHDFPEVFWVAQGCGTHLVNGKERPLAPGVLVTIRPADAHGFRSDDRGTLVRNIAIRPNVLAHVKRRYFLQDDLFWGGSAGRVPPHRGLDTDQLRLLQTLFDELSHGPWDVFATERFLLNLFHALLSAPQIRGAPGTAEPELPGWLASALARWRDDVKSFEEGTAALARLACRSPEHVARTLREYTGKTPTDCLNEARISHAARQLAITDRKILDIAMECGFDSLGHFYSIFHKAQGCAPRAYRMRFQPRPI